MTVFNLGSINIDYVYRLSRSPLPGETLAADSFERGLGGKGANQSVAVAQAGGQVVHVGAIGSQSDWTIDKLQDAGVDVRHVAKVQTATGHAVIYVDQDAENSIVLFPGANDQIEMSHVSQALIEAKSGDWFLLQNETSTGPSAAKLAHEKGLKVCYSAAPFSIGAVAEVLPYTSLLIVNEIEYQQLLEQLPNAKQILSAMELIVTYGSKGAIYAHGKIKIEVAAHRCEVVDTTGAGDTFLGYTLALLDRGQTVEQAMKLASAAAAIQVSRKGAADAIPALTDVQDFLQTR
jgi:ribokinase